MHIYAPERKLEGRTTQANWHNGNRWRFVERVSMHCLWRDSPRYDIFHEDNIVKKIITLKETHFRMRNRTSCPPGWTKNSSYYSAPVGARTRDLPHAHRVPRRQRRASECGIDSPLCRCCACRATRCTWSAAAAGPWRPTCRCGAAVGRRSRPCCVGTWSSAARRRQRVSHRRVITVQRHATITPFRLISPAALPRTGHRVTRTLFQKMATIFFHFFNYHSKRINNNNNGGILI